MIFSLFYILILIYFFKYETIVHWVPAFFMHNKLVLSRLCYKQDFDTFFICKQRWVNWESIFEKCLKKENSQETYPKPIVWSNFHPISTKALTCIHILIHILFTRYFVKYISIFTKISHKEANACLIIIQCSVNFCC